MSTGNRIFFIFSLLLFSLNICGQSTKTKIPIPNVIGLTLEQATNVLKSKNLAVGAIIHDSETENFDSLIVYQQNPSSKSSIGIINYIRKGQLIDLWLIPLKIISDSSQKPIQKVKVGIAANSIF